MGNRGQWILVLVIVGVLGGALVAGMVIAPAMAPVGVESKAPDFEALHLATGDTVGIDRYRGQVILLNIWATYCIPCEVEMPSIQRLYEALGPEGLAVVAISVDEVGSERVRAWVEERNLTFDVLHDRSGRIERAYQTIGIPETFVIDRERVIVKKIIGATEWDHPTHMNLLRRLLGAKTDREESDT